MLRSRFNLLTAAAGTLSLLALAGCPNAGTQPPVTSSPAATGSPAATTSPATSGASPTQSPTGGQTGNGGATSSPSVTPSAPANLAPTTVSGKVYDEDGAVVSGAKVRVRSLNPSAPFDTTVDVTQGAYVANSVPSGVQVEISASKDNWTTRSRVTSLLPIGEGRKNVVNFGSTEEGDTNGGGYFISDFPEIVSAVADAATLKGETLSYKVTLSEPLDSTNRSRFQDYFVITSDQAVPGAGTIELNENSSFEDDDVQPVFTWDTEGKVLTVTFAAPLWAQEDDEVTYRFRLRRTATGEAIEDAAGNDLGFTVPAAGGFYTEAFRISAPTLASTDDTDTERWAATHSGSASFEVAEDGTDPTLTGVSVSTLADRTRISLTFSEAMAVFGGANSVYGTYAGGGSVNSANLTAVASLESFTFAVGETAAALDDVELDGDAPQAFNTNQPIGDVAAERETEFRLAPAGAATVAVMVNPNDAKTLRIEVLNPNLFDNDVNAIKARVENISDPAGNNITETGADANVKTGNI